MVAFLLLLFPHLMDTLAEQVVTSGNITIKLPGMVVVLIVALLLLRLPAGRR